MERKPAKLFRPKVDSQTVFNNQINPVSISIQQMFDSAEKLNQPKKEPPKSP